MKGLKKLALASAVAAVSAGAQAELKALDDSAMGELTGQAGLTIDVETKWSIGEFMYKDAGSLLIRGISMGGDTAESARANANYSNMDGSYLDNIRMTIDIAGDGSADANGVTVDNTFNYGFSEIEGLAKVLVNATNSDAGILAAATGIDVGNPAGPTAADAQRTYDDGDLVIHFGFTDAFQKGGGFLAYAVNGTGYDVTNDSNDATLATLDFASAREIATRAVDFNFAIDAIGLTTSAYEAADMGTAAWVGTDHVLGVDTNSRDTVLISDLDIRGYLGPADLHIENNGNGFGAVDADANGYLDDAEIDNLAAPGVGRGAANSKIYWGSYFRITDLDVYLDIAGLQLDDVTFHNDRGDTTGLDGTSAFGFAHSRRTIYAVKDSVINLLTLVTGPSGNNTAPFVDGLALNTEFKGDIDIGALSFGDTGESIGSIFMTDVQSDTRWTISAH